MEQRAITQMEKSKKMAKADEKFRQAQAQYSQQADFRSSRYKTDYVSCGANNSMVDMFYSENHVEVSLDAFLASEEYAKESRRADKYDQTECCDTRAIISF